MRLLPLLFLCTSLLANSALAQKKQIVMTIDDLPFVGTTNNHPRKLKRENDRLKRIIATLVEKKIPAVGFVIAGSFEKGQWEIVEDFKNKGFVVANHTYSHRNLSRTPTARYIHDIDRADEKLKPLMEGVKYFRYPYLSESRGLRKQEVKDHLAQTGYVIAPVTIDSKDFRFSQQLFAIPYRQRKASLPRLKKRYLNYMWRQTLRAEKTMAKNKKGPKAQILLIHANLLNSHALADIIDMYHKRGYEFVSLDKALPQDEPAPLDKLDS